MLLPRNRRLMSPSKYVRAGGRRQTRQAAQKRKGREKREEKKTEHNVTLGASREEDKRLLALFFFFSRSCAVCFVTFTPLFVRLYVFLSWSLTSFCSFFSFISVDQKQANKKPKWKKKKPSSSLSHATMRRSM